MEILHGVLVLVVYGDEKDSSSASFSFMRRVYVQIFWSPPPHTHPPLTCWSSQWKSHPLKGPVVQKQHSNRAQLSYREHLQQQPQQKPPRMESRLVILALFAVAAAPIAAGNTLIVSNQPQDYFVDDPITEILTEGMELALKHCQLQFHQDPWNCPIKDFVAKQQQNPTLDRESAFVQSITVAAIAYTLAKNCSGVGKEKSSFCQCAFKDMNGVKDVYDCFSSIEDTENELTSQIISKLSGGDQVAYDPQGMMRLQNSRAGLYVS